MAALLFVMHEPVVRLNQFPAITKSRDVVGAPKAEPMATNRISTYIAFLHQPSYWMSMIVLVDSEYTFGMFLSSLLLSSNSPDPYRLPTSTMVSIDAIVL